MFHTYRIAFVVFCLAAAAVGCSRESAPAAPPPAASGGLRVEARADGFYPSTITVPADTPTTVEFVRTADKTCNTAVVLGGTGERHELPLNTPVAITLTVPAGKEVSFACPMDMYKGAIRAADGDTSAVSPQASATHEHPDDIAYWTCSMHPSVKSQTPGTCPICSMDLTPVTRQEVETGVILVDAQRRQLIGVKTGPVERRELAGDVRAVGHVAIDETRVRDVTLRTDAWIQSVEADFTGKLVRKGEPLLTYFSPDLFQLQTEYLQVAGDANRGAAARAGAENRLRLRGVETQQIDALAKRETPLEYLTVTAPITGTVLEKHVVAGSQAAAGMPLYRIVDLSVVWIDVNIFEQDFSRIAVGQNVHITVEALQRQQFEGKVSYVYPSLDPMTRAGRVRVEIPNPDGALKLDMYADVHLELPFGERLAVPENAVIFAGASHVAFVDLGEGRLEPRRLKIGVRTTDFIEVLEGLKDGETVVTSANFLIAAESKLKSGIEKW